MLTIGSCTHATHKRSLRTHKIYKLRIHKKFVCVCVCVRGVGVCVFVCEGCRCECVGVCCIVPCHTDIGWLILF